MSDATSLAALLQGGAGAAQIFDALSLMDTVAQGAWVASLNPVLRQVLPGRPAKGHLSDRDKALLRMMFDHTPDGEPETLARLLGLRFGLQLGPDRSRSEGPPESWEARGLRHLWPVLEGLPAADVENNDRLHRLVRYVVDTGSQAEGAYFRLTAAIGYDPSTVDQPDRSFSQPTDPLFGTNAFNETVRHEVGHAVDAHINATTTYADQPGWGGWRTFPDVAAAVRAMVEASDGPVHRWRNDGERELLLGWLAAHLHRGDNTPIAEMLGQVHFLDETGRTQIKQDPALQAATLGKLQMSPWMRDDLDGGVPVGGRIFQEAYEGQWVSYDHAARSRKVSLYQFRAPGEWFAEAYAAYFEPAPGVEQGSRLKQRDPATWVWMNENLGRKG